MSGSLARRLSRPFAAIAFAICGLGSMLIAAPAPAQPAAPRAPVVIRDAGQETSIVADELQQVGGATELLVATGNVEITQGATRLLADRVEINRDTGEAIAQGRVVFFDGQDRLVGDRVDYNLKTGTGVVFNGSTLAEPFYRLSGKRMDRIGDGIYQVQRGVFTTCEGDEPAWSFRFNSATADLNDIVFGTGASFWVRNIPLIPYFPLFAAAIRRERQTGFLFPEFGNSTQRGASLKVPFYWAISDSQDLTMSLDTFTRRGIGGEAEYRYSMSERARGIVNGFLIPEFLRNPQDRERLDIPETRGYLSGKHEWLITPRLSFKVDGNVTTDDLVFREYGDRISDRAQQRAETNVFLSQRWDSWSLTGNVMWYQDLTTPVATELQRVPEIKLFGVRQPVPKIPGMLYETQGSFTNFYRVVGDGGVRLDMQSRAFYPIPVAGLVTFTPFAGSRLTYYNQRAVGQSFTHTVWVEDTVYDPRVRRQIETGVEAETRVTRVFGLDGWGGLQALQHLIEPRTTFTLIRGLDQKALPQYDPSIDKIGRITEISYSLTNRLNAKTVAGPDGEAVRWEAVRLALFQRFDLIQMAQGRQPFKDLQGEFILDPNRIFRFRADAAYNMYGLGFRSASADLSARYRDVALTFGSRYNAISGTNYLVGEVTARVLNDLDGHVSTDYDARAGQLLEQRVGIDWRFQCFAITAEYVWRHEGDNQFRFSINLLGVGQFGSKVGAGGR